MTPRRVETSLVVLEQFRDPAGGEWMPGDRAPLARAAIRAAAANRPELFAVEHETLPLDPEEPWFLEVVARYDEQYAQVKRRRSEEEAERQAALRAELKEQEKDDPRDLKRRYKRQQDEWEKRKEQARDDRERRQIENELEYMGGFK